MVVNAINVKLDSGTSQIVKCAIVMVTLKLVTRKQGSVFLAKTIPLVQTAIVVLNLTMAILHWEVKLVVGHVDVPTLLLLDIHFAKECALISSNKDVICYCEVGYSGARCDVCDNNYFGNPEKPGGICQQCNCNHNIDLSRPGNCDVRSGKCLQCLYDSAGENCEYCRDGFFGNAVEQNCTGNK